MEGNPRASIIIPIYNGETEIRGCLNSVLAQDIKDYEIIAVDSSQDTTPEIIAQEFPRVRLFHFDDRKSCGEAKNIGIEKSRGEYIFFLDVDGRVDKYWLRRVLAIFERKKKIKGLCGSMESCAKHPVWGGVDCLLKYYHWPPNGKRMDNARYLVGGSSVYKREVFSKNRFDKVYGEDVILSTILADSGTDLLFEPGIKIKKTNPETYNFPSFLNSQLTAGRGSAVTRKKADRAFRIFLKFPVLIFFAPVFIVPKIGLTYLLRKDFINLGFFLRSFPLFLLGNFFWAIGFFKEAVNRDVF